VRSVPFDNAPTYLVFFNTAGDPQVLMNALSSTRYGHPAGSVFMPHFR
jgi:Na+/H+ antiporter NhaD/arsenite permease-like protein